MTSTSPPLVTLAFPLYRSMRFFDYIVENIERVTYPNLEILVGDRHLLDDAVEQLQKRFPDDPRIRYITANDELNWVEHWNLLLQEGAGKYFIWMPHDDSMADGFLETLVAHLESTPEAVLAFGTRDPVSVDGKEPWHWVPPPLIPGEPWTMRTIVRMTQCWNLGSCMRSVFRREPVVSRCLWIRPSTGLTSADMFWLVGVAMLGRFDYVPVATFIKRLYRDSTSDQWKPLPFLERPRLISAYIASYAPSTWQRIEGITLVWLTSVLYFAVGAVNRVARREAISYEALRRFLTRVLR